MRLAHDAATAPTPEGGYSQAIEVRGARRTLYVSGQVPVAPDGASPPEFDEQCRLVWRNVESQLTAAAMGFDNLVKVTTFLSDRRYAEANAAIRREVLGDRRYALTVVIAGIFDPGWHLEIEAIAVD